MSNISLKTIFVVLVFIPSILFANTNQVNDANLKDETSGAVGEFSSSAIASQNGASSSSFDIKVDRATALKPSENLKISDDYNEDYLGYYRPVDNKNMSPSEIRKVIDMEIENASDAIVNGHIEIAISLYKSVLSKDPRNQMALFGLASSYHRMGQFKDARPLYMTLLRLNPNHHDGLNNFLMLVGEESPEKALNELLQLQKINGNYSPIYAQIGMLYSTMGDNEKALEYFFKATENASPKDNIWLYKYNLAVLFDRKSDYSQALILYKEISDAVKKGAILPVSLDQIEKRITYLDDVKI